MTQHFNQCLSLLCIAMLSGCGAIGDKESILPQEGPSMQEVYDNHFRHHGNRQRLQRESHKLGMPGQRDGSRANTLAGYTREVNNEIENLFPRLPNPPLVMYIFPHLAAGGQPVPGYATSFPFYDKVEYALPGEAEGR